MVSSSSILRLICRKGIGTRCCVSSWFSYRGFHHHHDHQMSLKQPSRPTTSSCSSPWLMLSTPGDSELNFYSLAENRVLSVPVEKEISHLLPKLDFMGSSHGWLGLYNPYNFDLFLYNPISRRRVDLPPVRTLPNLPRENLDGGHGCVVKLILSCDPKREDHDCRVMMTYNTYDALAFCCPGKSKEWTPIGQLYDWDEDGVKWARTYNDFVYSHKQQVFFCLGDGCELDLESWDLRDPSSPTMTLMYKVLEELENYDPKCKGVNPTQLNHLVLTESDELLLVRQQVKFNYLPNHLLVRQQVKFNYYLPNDDWYRQTIGFDVFIYDPQERDFKYMDDMSSLGGLALFVGFYNHSTALSTSEFPELKPNSIYFTDPYMSPSKTVLDDYPFQYCGHNIGIFDYQDKTISPCYYPCDAGRSKIMVPAPMWFFPSQT